MTNSSSACDSQKILIQRRLGRLAEPMKTRVRFYVERTIASKNHDEALTQGDIDRCVGRAYRDMLDDRAVRFDRDAVHSAFQQIDQGKTVPLQELVNGSAG